MPDPGATAIASIIPYFLTQFRLVLISRFAVARRAGHVPKRNENIGNDRPPATRVAKNPTDAYEK